MADIRPRAFPGRARHEQGRAQGPGVSVPDAAEHGQGNENPHGGRDDEADRRGAGDGGSGARRVRISAAVTVTRTNEMASMVIGTPEPNAPASRPGAAATAAVGLAFIEQSRAVAAEFIATAHEEAKQWQDVAFLGNADLWLTVEEISKVTAALAAALQPFRGRALTDRPDGTRRVRVMNMVIPHRQH